MSTTTRPCRMPTAGKYGPETVAPSVERRTGSDARARCDVAHHHAVDLALGPVVDEPRALVHRASAVVEEGRFFLPPPAGVVRVALDETAAGPRDQLDRSAQSDHRQPLTAAPALDLDAGHT